jgi:hypothetical protein
MARDLFDAGDAEGCITKCRKNLSCVHIETWWTVANLLTAVDAKDEWDDEAQYFFATAGTVIERHWPKDDKTGVRATYDRLARQRRAEGADVDPLPAYQPRWAKKCVCSCDKAAQEYAGGTRPLPDIGALRASFHGLLSREASDRSSDGMILLTDLEANHPANGSRYQRRSSRGRKSARATPDMASRNQQA